MSWQPGQVPGPRQGPQDRQPSEHQDQIMTREAVMTDEEIDGDCQRRERGKKYWMKGKPLKMRLCIKGET